MRFALATVLTLLSLNTFAGDTLTLDLDRPGRYLVTLVSPESCTPTQFAITAATQGTQPFSYLNATTSEIVNTDIQPTVCRAGHNVARGLVTVVRRTRLTIDLEGTRGAIIMPRIILEQVIDTKSIKK